MSVVRRFKNWIGRMTWRRVRERVEERVTPPEQRLQAVTDRMQLLEGLDARFKALEGVDARLRSVEGWDERIRSLEAAWQEHSPALLNAAASVGALGHELVALRKALDAAIVNRREPGA